MTYSINNICEFVDKKLEKEYFEHYFSNSLKAIRINTIIVGIIYAALSIYDFVFLINHYMFFTIILIRFSVLMLSFLIFNLLGKIKNINKAVALIIFFEFCILLSYFFILSKIEYTDFLQKCLGIMVLLIINMSIPNKWKYSVITEVVFFSIFLIWSYNISTNVDIKILFQVLAYFVIIIIFLSISSHRVQVISRKEYAKKCEIETIMTTDKLTGISNRRKFDLLLENWIDLSIRYDNIFSIVMFDIDNFKNVNDVYGHIIGDEVLVKTCEVVSENIRSCDFFSRWGGEEFVILLPNTNIERSYELAERIRIKISETNYPKNQKLTCSFGVSQYEKKYTANEIMESTDKLLYKAKKSGKNIVIKNNVDLKH